jgi:hypothetical protein
MMNAIRLTALGLLGAAHGKALYDEVKAEKRDVTQMAVSGAIVTLCTVAVVTILKK